MTDQSSEKASFKTCCSPARTENMRVDTVNRMKKKKTYSDFATVKVLGGIAFLGTNQPQIPDDGESPFCKKRLKPFRIGRTVVTNQEFQEFVDETGYVTDAEQFGWSFVFWSEVSKLVTATQGVHGAGWWRRVDGATWKNINGPGTEAEVWHPDHPVVQVSHADASAYASWAGGRLPSELEWEHAARAGQSDAPFPWGDTEPNDTDNFPCNIWQGDFPYFNTGMDGWKTTAPAKSYQPNAFGLYNMVGNVWEWTGDTYRVKSRKKHVRQRMSQMRGFKLLKGGSFICHRSYCYRYRIAARTGNSPESSTTHQGVRIVWDI
ncbi:MAG: formylglycine-generating enzyme family protein [Rhodobacteraceae bacterium]|nr:formylglycine-generating enzyme family protein [Paracoccaceae bacterium]MCY4248840.1 formylglycine-generating enzyme family protein [Paracoccaceae bacterium]